MPRPMDDEDDLYDNYDQDPAAPEEKSEDVGEPFLAPKASFKGDLSPGTIHRVRIEASHDEELELVCLGESKPDEEEPEPMAEDENASLYE